MDSSNRESFQSHQWFSLAKVYNNRKQYLNCVKYLTKALYFGQHIDYYLMRCEAYLAIAGQTPALGFAINLADKDLQAVNDEYDPRVKRLMDRMAGVKRHNSADNCPLTGAQELTAKIVAEKYGNASPGRLIEYYIMRSVCYERMGTDEADEMSAKDYGKCHQFDEHNQSDQFVVNRRDIARKRLDDSLSQTAAHYVTSDDTADEDSDLNPNECRQQTDGNTDEEEAQKASADEAYSSDDVYSSDDIYASDD